MLSHSSFYSTTNLNLKYLLLLSLWCLALCLPFQSARAQDTAPLSRCTPSPEKVLTSKISEVMDFQTVKLENGQIIRLAGLYIPTTLGSALSKEIVKEGDARLANMTRFLKKSLVGQSVFYSIENSPNRYGYHVAMLYLSPKMVFSVQEVIITKGLAVFYALSRPITCSQNLLQAERKARQLKTGLWGRKNDLLLQAKPVKTLNWKTQNFHLVEGRIDTITQKRMVIYFNFDKDWRTDFTIILKRNDLAGLEKKGIKLKDLEHKKVRIRGWMDFRNGPYIPLQIADNIEILE